MYVVTEDNEKGECVLLTSESFFLGKSAPSSDQTRKDLPVTFHAVPSQNDESSCCSRHHPSSSQASRLTEL